MCFIDDTRRINVYNENEFLIIMHDTINYFRPRKLGPELAVEDAVVRQIPELFSNNYERSWTAGSVPIGAGLPDLIVASYNPDVLKLSQIESSNSRTLAYLRMNRFADLNSLMNVIKLPRKRANAQIERLLDEKVIFSKSKGFFLCPIWFKILPEIVTIEAKVNDWQKAIVQANRNKIFAHRSFIALPENVAKRIRKEPILNKLGLGLLSVDDDCNVSVLRKGRRSNPFVWNYYYKLAFLIANNQRKPDAIHSSH